MKHRSGFLQFLFCGIMISGFVGCDSPNAKKQTYETLVFQVDESRLEPTVTDETLRIKIAAPKNWKKIDDAFHHYLVSNSERAKITYSRHQKSLGKVNAFYLLVLTYLTETRIAV